MAQSKIKFDQIDTINVSQLTGILPIDKGGTGVSVNTVDELINSLLPGQDGNENFVLSTDGTNIKWEAPTTFGTVTSVDVSGGTTGLTTTGGPIDMSGTITLDGILNISNGGTGISEIPGENGNLIYKNNGFDSTTNIFYSSSDLTIGDVGATFTIKGNSSISSESKGTNLVIKGGSGQTSSNRGGDISIEGGDTLAASGSRYAGNVTISAGVAGSQTLSGEILLKTFNTDRLKINSSGAWSLGENNYGIDGKVLISKGSSSAPEWGDPPVSIVTGVLPIANGGTGASTSLDAFNALLSNQSGNEGKVLSTDGTSVTWIEAGNVGTVTNIDVSGGTTGLTVTGGPITTVGTLTLGGTLAIANGGTGATTASDAINALLPTQTGNSGKYLTTNGTTASWGVAGSPGQLLFNSSGVVSGTGRITYNGTDTLQLGTGDTTFTIKTEDGLGSTNVGDILIKPGKSPALAVNNNRRGGNLTLSSGEGDSNNGVAGDLFLIGGAGPSGGSGGIKSGSIIFRTGNIVTASNKLVISSSGSWGLDGTNYGNSGQVLMSRGANLTPTWTDIAGEYTLPTASTTVLGGVKVDGSTITIDGDGVISSIPGSYTLPVASTTVLGGIKVGENLFIDSGTQKLNVIFPQASSTVEGVIKIGNGLTIDVDTSIVDVGGTVQNAISFAGAVTTQTTLDLGGRTTEHITSLEETQAVTTVNCLEANNFEIILTSDTSLAFNNVPTQGRLFYLALILKQDSSGGRTVSWPSAVKWPKNTPPTVTATANKYDIYTLMTYDGGNTWFGFIAGQDY